MSKRRVSASGGSWIRRASVSVLSLVVLAAPAWADETDAPGASAADAASAPPEALRTALGWKPWPEGENHQPYRAGSVFGVGSEPSAWPAAREQAAAWLAATPGLDADPADHLMRRLASIQAQVLGAAQPGGIEALRAERAALAEEAQRLRAKKTAGETDWRARNMADQLRQVGKALGQWLADTPAERAQAFREELESLRPADRAQIAARYGGEEKLAELIKLGQEFARLQAAQQSAMEDRSLPEAERKLAIRKASGALGYFYGFNNIDRGWHAAMQDPDLAADFGGDSGLDHRSINVPEIAAWMDEAAAARLLVETYALPVEVQLNDNGRTGALARRLLVEGRLEPKRVPWSLLDWPTTSVNAASAGELVAVYEAARKRFPDLAEKKPGRSDWNQGRALAAAASALAITGRLDEAAAVLAKTGLKQSGLPYRARISREAASAVFDLALRVAGEQPPAEGWDALLNLAGLAERSDELAALAARRAAEAAKDSDAARVWQARHAWALIAGENIDEGLAILAPCLDARPGPLQPLWREEWPKSAARLLNLARALGRAELAQPWSGKLAADLKDPAGPLWADDTELLNAFAAAELSAGDSARVEAILRARITARSKPRVSGPADTEDYSPNSDSLHATTARLADMLGRQGRHAEVLALLAESPHWDKPDLAGYLRADADGPWRPLPLIVAEALIATGRGDEAAAILEASLSESSGYDPSYALYTRLRGAQAAPFLEKLWAADRYEERPLIWLASLQLAAGRTDEAEATVKRAIATDPSDGEQPKGDRMRAYAVLRDVALVRGDAQQAEFLAGVLAAIRRSENADDIAQAGLIDRAIKEYELALESFADAYCIQSRLARKLAEENRLPEAMEHYKRAFELMPDSFGRVESHCFGCEQAFAGEDAQAVAERVFTGLAAKPGAKPQVAYLLGYLRMEQERWDEAADYFSKAAAADPEYLNAWKKLSDVLPNTARPRAERDRAAFRLLALDAAGRHGGAGDEKVRDLPALWRAYSASLDTTPAAPEKIFPLGDRAPKTTPADNRGPSLSDGRTRPRRPAERLARHDALEAVGQALDAVHQWRVSAL